MIGPREMIAGSRGRYAEMHIGKERITIVDRLSKQASTFISYAIVGKPLIHSVK
jgi:hypothetical protein